MATYCVHRLLKSIIGKETFGTRSVYSTPLACARQSGKYKQTPKKNRPLTYEMVNPPEMIACRKSWNTWNTTTIEGGLRTAETIVDDLFIRKFLNGTFPKLIASTVIIKRQHNIIRVAFLLVPKIATRKIAFLIAYAEELLSHWLQCPVKLEIEFIADSRLTVYRYI